MRSITLLYRVIVKMDYKDIGSIGMAEAAKIAKDFIREIIGSVKHTPESSKFDKEKKLWVITESIKPGAMEDIDLEEIVRESLHEMDKTLSRLQVLRTSEKYGDIKLSFYITSSGRILAVVPAFIWDANTEANIEQIINSSVTMFKQDENLKDNDAKYYSLMAKKYIESATTFKYFDFIPWLVCRLNKEEWYVSAIIIFYSKFESFVKIYEFRMSDKGIIESKALTTDKKFNAKE